MEEENTDKAKGKGKEALGGGGVDSVAGML